ncbi:MAG: OmpA family protein [Planctomycetes bacterium]|nr:OmpA family protein [Planctomycetota bacterium]MCW8134587.1 OmpA family protein [Planctomycetota bacterium]
MKKILLSLVAAPALALLGGCVSLDSYEQTQAMYEAEAEANAALAAENSRLESALSKERSDKQALQKSLEDMKTAAANTPKVKEDDLVEMMKKIWGGNMGEWETVRSGGAVGVRLDDSGVLFQSGSWTLTDNTKKTLTKLADIMKGKMANPNMFVRIDGHTDGDPIKNLAKQGIKDNTHLSALRAMAVREFLATQGIPKERIFVAGFGEHWPIAGGNTSRDKQRNRRVEVYMGDADALSIGALPSKPQVSKK